MSKFSEKYHVSQIILFGALADCTNYGTGTAFHNNIKSYRNFSEKYNGILYSRC